MPAALSASTACHRARPGSAFLLVNFAAARRDIVVPASGTVTRRRRAAPVAHRRRHRDRQVAPSPTSPTSSGRRRTWSASRSRPARARSPRVSSTPARSCAPARCSRPCPGVIISQHSGEGKANQYYLRGFNLDHGTDFATTVAGMPVNMPTHGHGHGYSDLNFLIPELVSGVQFSKGPYFAEQGDFATAGAGNINYTNSLARPIVRVGGGGQGFAPGAGRGVADRWRRHAARRARGRSTTTGRGIRPDDYRKVNGVVRYTPRRQPQRLFAHGMGYDGDVELHRPGAAPRRRRRRASIASASLDTTDGGDTYRYSGSFDWQRTARQRQHTRHRLRHRLRPQPLLELHVPPRRSRERRPVPPGRSPRSCPAGEVSHRRVGQWGSRAVSEHLRPADPQRRHRQRRALSHRAAGTARDHAPGRGAADERRRSTRRTSCRGRRGCGRWRASASTATGSTSRPAIRPTAAPTPPGWPARRAAR